MASHRDAYVSDVTVVADVDEKNSMDSIVSSLSNAGLTVDEVNHEQGVVEGTIEAAKVSQLREIPNIKYVRVEMSYIADYPTGDPRDLDGPETD